MCDLISTQKKKNVQVGNEWPSPKILISVDKATITMSDNSTPGSSKIIDTLTLCVHPKPTTYSVVLSITIHKQIYDQILCLSGGAASDGAGGERSINYK